MYFCSKSRGMTSKMKLKIKAGIFSGLFGSFFMAAIDYFTEDKFSWVKIVIHFVMFGVIFGILAKEKKVEDSKNLGV
jgi:H+/Cl- antiporter ClcA